MTTTYDWVDPNYRRVPLWPAYVMGPDLDVWSLPREVRCKGGKTRQTAAKQLTPTTGGCACPRMARPGDFMSATTFTRGVPRAAAHLPAPVAQASPDDGAGQSGHLLQFGTGYPCRLLGTGNRICLWCNDPPEAFPDDNAYSLQYGVAGMPEYSSLPAQPTPREEDRYQLEEMDWAARGFIISDRPYYNVDPFPQVD